MVKTLGTQEKCSEKLPFAMFFAIEPSFTSIPKEVLEQDLRYNPIAQINDESRLATTLGSPTSTSIKKSTTSYTGPGWTGKDDDDTMGDESG